MRTTWPSQLLGGERFVTPKRTQWPYLGMRTLGNSEISACLWLRIQCWWKNLFLDISLDTKGLMNFPVHHLEGFRWFYYLYFHEDPISSTGCPDGLGVSTLLSNISAFRQVYVPGAVKLSVHNTNSGRYISPWLQPMVKHRLTWLQGVHIACWQVLSKVTVNMVILEREEGGWLWRRHSGFTPLLEAPST